MTTLSKPTYTHQRLQKYFCECTLDYTLSTVYITVRATSEAHASELVHQGYNIEFVLDILTPLQMEYKKRHLRPSLMSSITTTH